MPLLYKVCNWAQRRTLDLFADCEVEGRENVPSVGPLILVANHQSNLDPPLISATMPRRVRFLAKQEIFEHPVSSWFLRTYGAFPLNRSGPDLKAFRWALRHLRRDGVIAIFPEGARSQVGMKRATPGVVRLALKSQAALLPVGVTGTKSFGSALRVFYPTGKIRIKIGTVFSIPSIEGRLSEAVSQSLADMIMMRIAELLPPEYRGVYGSGSPATAVSSTDA